MSTNKIRAVRAGDVDPDAKFPEEFLVMRGEFFVCTVHGGGLFDDDVEGERAAERIASLLREFVSA